MALKREQKRLWTAQNSAHWSLIMGGVSGMCITRVKNCKCMLRRRTSRSKCAKNSHNVWLFQVKEISWACQQIVLGKWLKPNITLILCSALCQLPFKVAELLCRKWVKKESGWRSEIWKQLMMILSSLIFCTFFNQWIYLAISGILANLSCHCWGHSH